MNPTPINEVKFPQPFTIAQKTISIFSFFFFFFPPQNSVCKLSCKFLCTKTGERSISLISAELLWHKSLQELTKPLSPFYRWQDCSEEHHFRHLSLNWYLLSQQAEYFQTINTTRLSYRLIKYTQITSKFTWGAWIGFQKTADIAASQIFSLSRASNYHLLWWLHFLHLFHTHFFSLTRNSTFNKNFFKADEDLSGTEIIPTKLYHINKLQALQY